MMSVHIKVNQRYLIKLESRMQRFLFFFLHVVEYTRKTKRRIIMNNLFIRSENSKILCNILSFFKKLHKQNVRNKIKMV